MNYKESTAVRFRDLWKLSGDELTAGVYQTISNVDGNLNRAKCFDKTDEFLFITRKIIQEEGDDAINLEESIYDACVSIGEEFIEKTNFGRKDTIVLDPTQPLQIKEDNGTITVTFIAGKGRKLNDFEYSEVYVKEG